MNEKRLKIINPILGEVAQEAIEMAEIIAQRLLASELPREEVNLKLPDGREISGIAFRQENPLIVTDYFLATTDETGQKIAQFLPRR